MMEASPRVSEQCCNINYPVAVHTVPLFSFSQSDCVCGNCKCGERVVFSGIVKIANGLSLWRSNNFPPFTSHAWHLPALSLGHISYLTHWKLFRFSHLSLRSLSRNRQFQRENDTSSDYRIGFRPVCLYSNCAEHYIVKTAIQLGSHIKCGAASTRPLRVID